MLLEDKNKIKEKFAIVGMPRTGSNMLVQLLDGQESMICHSELFNSDDFYLSNKLEIDEKRRKELKELRGVNPVIFLKNIISLTPPQFTFVGFKILIFNLMIFLIIFLNPQISKLLYWVEKIY